MPRLVHLLLATSLLATIAFIPKPARTAWSLDEALDPAPLSLQLDHRTRYEHLDPQFRSGGSGREDGVFSRTLLHGRVDLPKHLTAGVELLDSRSYLSDDVRLNTTTNNAVELLQAYLEWEQAEVVGGTLRARGGRITMDVGGRRLVARNRFRNTINGFCGIDLHWKNDAGTELRGFWVLPLQRLPADRDSLQDNDIVLDEEHLDVQFWGLFAAHTGPVDSRIEGYWLGLHEADRSDRATRNRRIFTPGVRIVRPPAESAVDFQFETSLQFGRSRASTSSTEDLDHFAHFHHLSLGYTFALSWSPRVVAQYDYASGDDDPEDGDNGRFDTLFGARRFELGPTGIYGPFARANLNTPGLRVLFRPHATVQSMIAWRAFWLASSRDAWTTAAIVDPLGDSGSFLANQIEVRLRWDVVPGNARFETGYAHLFDGSFIDDTPGDHQRGDVDYFYTQLALSI